MNIACSFPSNILKISSQFSNIRCLGAQQVFQSLISRDMSVNSCSVILKRKFPIDSHKKGHRPQKLRGRHFVYEYVQGMHNKEEPLEVILTQYVDGIGKKGEKVKLKRQFAYNNLLLPKLAVYANPENEALYGSSTSGSSEQEYSTKYAPRMIEYLSRSLVAITMNKEVPWTLEPWHIRVCARKAGIIIADDSCIELPESKISGPDMSLENKEFLVTVTLNKKEKAKMRCRIHHWSTEPGDRIFAHYPWFEKAEAIFEQQSKDLADIPLPQFRLVEKSAPEFK